MKFKIKRTNIKLIKKLYFLKKLIVNYLKKKLIMNLKENMDPHLLEKSLNTPFKKEII